MTKKSLNKPRTTAKDRNDGDPAKSFPNGISSTIRAIMKYWHHTVNGGPTDLSRLRFLRLTNFEYYYDEVEKKYPGAKGKPAAAKMIDDCNFGRPDLQYYKLRTFADFVNLPAGLFLLFTQLVSEERSARETGLDSRQQTLASLRRLRKTIEAIEVSITNVPLDEPVFTKEYAEGYLPDMRMLNVWREAYLDSRDKAAADQ